MALTGLSTVISASSSNVMVFIKLANPLSTTSSLLVTYPLGLSVTYSGSNTPISTTSTSMVFNNIVASNTAPDATVRVINKFIVTNVPHTMSSTLTFATFYNSGGTIYNIDSGSYTYSCASGSLTGTVAPSNLLVNAVTPYVLTLTIANALVSGSFVNVVVPTGLTISGTCSSNVAATCAWSGQNVTLTPTSNIPAGSQVQMTFTVRNLNAAFTSPVFNVYSYYSNYSTLIDTLSSTLTVTMVPNTLTTATVTPSSTQIAASATYTFSINNIDAIPPGGKFTLTLPSEVTCSSTPSLGGSLEATCTPTYTPATSTVLFTNCFQLNPKSNSTPLSFTLGPIINPRSLSPSSSFSFYSYDSSNHMIDYLNSSLNTFRVTMSTVGSMSVTLLIAN